MPLAYITRRIPKPGFELMKEVFEVDFFDDDEAIPHDTLVEAMKKKRYDVLYCMLTDQIDEEVLEAAGPQLKIVATMSVGYEHIDLQGCAKRNILVANTPGVSTDSVAELTVSLLLMTARRITEGTQAVKNGEWGEWKPMWLCGTELTGTALGIYGLGRIGFNVGRRLKPFGFKKIYYTDVHEVSYAKDLDAEFIDFEGLVKNCDFICVCCNLTPQTKHMFNTTIFKKMKNNAILVNTGRGGVINHDDLVEALKNGDIRGAGLDVTEPEPLPKTHPLTDLLISRPSQTTFETNRSSSSTQNQTVLSTSLCPPPQSCQLHTTKQMYDLMEFFDNKENWGEKKVVTGRPYRLDELRIKSNQDLHKLWYVLLKERNMLLTMEAEYTRNTELFPNPERIEKVEESMENILEIVKERDNAVSLLETGEKAEPGGSYVRDYLGRVVYKEHKEHAVPPHMNKVHRLLYPRAFRRENLNFLPLWREKIARHKWAMYHRRLAKNRDLVARFPHLEGKLTATKPEEPPIN